MSHHIQSFHVLAAVSVVAAPAFFMSHESPLQQQHDLQQLSVVFFWSACEGVWAVTAINAAAVNPEHDQGSFLTGSHCSSPYQEIGAMHAGQKHTNTLFEDKRRLSGAQQADL